MKPLLLLVGIFFLSVFSSHVQAQGTAFTYQGQLVNGGIPANGSYDLTFTLFNTNCTGIAIAGPVTNSATTVSNGLFTTTIDFGSGAFIGTSNWLEIAVRTNGAGSFTTLTPRQQITPTPYAIYSANAGTASNAMTAATITGSLPNSSLSGAYGEQVTLNNSSNMISGTFYGNGGGLTNLPFAETFSSTNGYFTFTTNPDGSTNVTFILTNLNAQTITGTLSETALPSSVVLTNGASGAGQVPTWNGTTYVWSVGGASGGNVASNTVVTFSAVFATNAMATNTLAGFIQVGTTNSGTTNSMGIDPPSGGLIMNSGLSITNQYLLTVRAATGLGTFPVATMIPVYSNCPMALDLMPSPGAIDYFGNGVAWLDICNTNCLTGTNNPPTLASLRLQMSNQAGTGAFIGTEKFGSGASDAPLILGANGISYLELDNNNVTLLTGKFQPIADGGNQIGWSGGRFSSLYLKTSIVGNAGDVVLSFPSTGTLQISTNVAVTGAISGGSLTVSNSASIKTNIAHFGTISENITLGTLFTNLAGGRADFVGQFTFSDPSGGNPILVVSNLTTGLVITNSIPVTSESAMQGIVFPDVSPGDVCEAYDASTDSGASVSFMQGWWIVK